MLYHIILMAALYFHFYNICGFTSSVSCMSKEIVDSLMKNNATYREQKMGPSDVNMTQFFDEHADIYVFRVVAPTPERILAGAHAGAPRKSGSRLSQKSVFLSEKGDVIQYRGNSEDMAAHDQRRA